MDKVSYETDFRSRRPDGRHVSSVAAFRERLLREPARLSLPENLTRESFEAWRAEVKETYRRLLHMPEFTEEPAPQRLSSVQRDGYRVEKWEYYPDPYTAVPFLALIPDGADVAHPVPGVLCLPGSTFSKEALAGEPLLETLNCQMQKYPERNCMAQHYVKAGMAAFAFDHIAIAEVGMPVTDPGRDGYNATSRQHLCYGYLHTGFNYPGMETFQLMRFLENIGSFPWVNREKLAVSGHSLGTEAAMALGVLCEEIRAVVFNDMLHSDRVRYVSITEYDDGNLRMNVGNWHKIPGFMENFDFPDLCAAMAPKPIAFNEGGADEFFRTVLRGYRVFDAEENVQITHYPKYADPASRTHPEDVPRQGLNGTTYFEHLYVDAPDHSFRAEPSVSFLRKVFF